MEFIVNYGWLVSVRVSYANPPRCQNHETRHKPFRGVVMGFLSGDLEHQAHSPELVG